MSFFFAYPLSLILISQMTYNRRHRWRHRGKSFIAGPIFLLDFPRYFFKKYHRHFVLSRTVADGSLWSWEKITNCWWFIYETSQWERERIQYFNGKKNETSAVAVVVWEAEWISKGNSEGKSGQRLMMGTLLSMQNRVVVFVVVVDVVVYWYRKAQGRRPTEYLVDIWSRMFHSLGSPTLFSYSLLLLI